MNHVKEIVVMFGEHDPYYTPSMAEDMSKRFNAKYVLLNGRGHCVASEGVTELPEILEQI